MKRAFLISASIIIAFMFAIMMSSCKNNNDGELKVEDIHAICELATVKCYYNNVAHIEKEKDNIFQKDRKMWIEYEGEAVIGVDMSKLMIEINDNVVNIDMPDAEILHISPIKESLDDRSYVESADGFFVKNKITTEEQNDAIARGQEEMESAVKENRALFIKAEDKARELLENYIVKMSKVIGREYIINWN